FRLKLAERGAGILRLAGGRQRHGELQKTVRSLGALRILLPGVGEGYGRFVQFAAHIQRFAIPIFGVLDQLVLRVLVDESSERFLGLVVIGLTQKGESGVILFLRRQPVIGRRLRQRRSLRIVGAADHATILNVERTQRAFRVGWIFVAGLRLRHGLLHSR